MMRGTKVECRGVRVRIRKGFELATSESRTRENPVQVVVPVAEVVRIDGAEGALDRRPVYR